MIKRVVMASAALVLSAALAHAQEVKIGLVAPFTGIGAELGQQIDRGVEQYLKLKGSEFAPYKIKIIKRDDKNRKCSTVGDGMHIFGITLVCCFTNLKCSSIG